MKPLRLSLTLTALPRWTASETLCIKYAHSGIRGFVEFILSRRGRRVLVIGSYKYNLGYTAGPTTRWRCCRKSHGCKACVYTVNDRVASIVRRGKRCLAVGKYLYSLHQKEGVKTRWRCVNRRLIGCNAFILFKPGKNIVIGGYKFSRHSRGIAGNRIRWTCSKKHKYKCRVSAISIDNQIISTSGTHTHPSHAI
ncbi:hypothetical protein JYU34_004429 [Plutella xylostella]|uniref:FLYWCH-type domain-containing protein n=1 Tax=Plutella xylostella TaxID=51655 RepID=A0ABQ7QY10_PLUXY|nr:hypothetical protein JYU34_004429 [Plutella xylostella]